MQWYFLTCFNSEATWYVCGVRPKIKVQYYVFPSSVQIRRASNGLSSSSLPIVLLQVRSPNLATVLMKRTKCNSCLSLSRRHHSVPCQSHPGACRNQGSPYPLVTIKPAPNSLSLFPGFLSVTPVCSCVGYMSVSGLWAYVTDKLPFSSVQRQMLWVCSPP